MLLLFNHKHTKDNNLSVYFCLFNCLFVHTEIEHFKSLKSKKKPKNLKITFPS